MLLKLNFFINKYTTYGQKISAQLHARYIWIELRVFNLLFLEITRHKQI